MYCDNCGAEISEQAKFCSTCGAGISLRPPVNDAGLPTSASKTPSGKTKVTVHVREKTTEERAPENPHFQESSTAYVNEEYAPVSSASEKIDFSAARDLLYSYRVGTGIFWLWVIALFVVPSIIGAIIRPVLESAFSKMDLDSLNAFSFGPVALSVVVWGLMNFAPIIGLLFIRRKINKGFMFMEELFGIPHIKRVSNNIPWIAATVLVSAVFDYFIYKAYVSGAMGMDIPRGFMVFALLIGVPLVILLLVFTFFEPVRLSLSMRRNMKMVCIDTGLNYSALGSGGWTFVWWNIFFIVFIIVLSPMLYFRSTLKKYGELIDELCSSI
jgi:hypothetical protein